MCQSGIGLTMRYLTMISAFVLSASVITDFTQALTIQSAVIGDSVILPCNIRSNITNDTTELVLWYRDTWESPIYKMDTRAKNKNSNLHSAYQDRASFHSGAEPAYLKIDSVREDDGGVYRCRVDFRKQRTINRKIKLVVVILPSNPIITNANGEKLSGEVGPYNEGQDSIFVCTVAGGKPPPAVRWWLKNEMKDNTSEEIKNGIVKNTFVFQSIPRDADLETLKCEASNIKTVFKTATIRLTLNYKPKTVAITSGRTPLSAGVEAQFRCRTSGSRPPADITWWKGSLRMTKTKQQVLISSDRSNDSHTTTVGTLTFTPTLQDNGKYLSCSASNAAISKSAIEDGWKIIVYYIPKASLHIKKLKEDNIVEGDDVSFECKIDANPYITDVQWTFNGVTIRETVDNGYQIKDLTLYISRVNASHMGEYVCLASNSQGTGNSNPVTLLIRYSPVCAYNTTIVYGASINDVVNVNCEVNANPRKVSFKWWKNGTSLVEDLTNFRENYSSSVARYSVKSEDDYSFLYCSGSNEVGSQSSPCSFHIIKAGPPDPVENCSIINETRSRVHVECDAGNDGGMRQIFYAEVYLHPQHILQSNISAFNQPIFVSRNLKPNAEYMFVIYAVNSKGRSNTVAIIANTKPGVSNKSALLFDLAATRTIAVLAGAVVTIIIILGAAIIVLRKRTHRCHEEDVTVKKKEEDSGEDKSYSEVEVLNPDVVPLNTLESVSGSIYPVYGEIPAPYLDKAAKNRGFVTLKQNGEFKSQDPKAEEDEVSYAELNIDLMKCPDPNRSLRKLRNEPRTEYARLDFNRQPKHHQATNIPDGGVPSKIEDLSISSKDVPVVISDSTSDIMAAAQSRLESAV